MYVVGMLDEVEFMRRSREEAKLHPVYGPFASFQEADAFAKTLSSDPNEAVAMELKSPGLKAVMTDEID